MADIPKNQRVPAADDIHEKPYWEHPHDPVDIVVIPSLPVECEEDFWRVPGLVHKEERHLFTTLFLQNPHARLIYITSYPLDPGTIQYYLSLLPPGTLQVAFDPERITTTDIPLSKKNGEKSKSKSNGKKDDDKKEEVERCSVTEFIPERFYNVCLHDMNDLSLADKLRKKQPELLKYIHQHLLRHPSPSSSPSTSTSTSVPLLTKRYLLCYRTSTLEEELAKELDLELMASPSRLDSLGTKFGSRSTFEEAGIPYLPGTTRLVYSVRELAQQIHDLIQREHDKGLSKIVVKLNDFSAGGGNSVLDLTPILKNDDGSKKQSLPSVDDIEKHFDQLDTPYDDQSPKDFLRFVPEIGVIAEKWAEPKTKGGSITSPSVQCMVTNNGSVKVLSTHGQVLNKHEYSGGTFPAKTNHHPQLCEYAIKCGQVLSKKGVRGHFGIDFVEVQEEDGAGWQAFAIELNLRCTGTTGPYMVLRLLAPGTYNSDKGVYLTDSGEEKYYVSTEGLKHDKLKGLKPVDLLAIQDGHKLLKWDHASKTGTLFHMLGAMKEHGKVGVTCIGNSMDDAVNMMERVKQVVEEMH